MIQLITLREAIRTITGLPEVGTPGKNRLNLAINYAFRRVWGDVPEVFIRSEHTIRLEPPVSEGTLTVHGTDGLVFYRPDVAATLATNGTLTARWIDIKRDDRIFTRRIRYIYTAVVAGANRSHIVVDEPWDNNTDSGLSYRIYTLDYPLPADTQAVRKAMICNTQVPDTTELRELQPEELEYWRMARGWQASGTPEAYCRGSAAQELAPHFTPTASLFATPIGGLTQKWGFDAGMVEHGAAFVGTQYGPAGTFSYRCCLGWGRLAFQNPTAEGWLPPFYISAPTSPSAQVTSTWAGGMIEVYSPDEAWVRGLGIDPTQPSYHKSGVEKWWFRARHATQEPAAAGNNAGVKRVESDGVYYLWRVTPAETTVTNDRGDDDPVDRRFMLKDFGGHPTIRFDVAPAEDRRVLVNTVRRPPTLDHDSDAVPVPAECTDALAYLVAAQLVGHRDGDPGRAREYEKEYTRRMTRLRGQQALARTNQGGFGNGISSGKRNIGGTFNSRIAG